MDHRQGQGLVCFISRSEWHGGVQYPGVTDSDGNVLPGFFVITLDELQQVQLESQNNQSRQAKVVPATPLREQTLVNASRKTKAKINIGAKRVTVSIFAHEFGHALGLSDEYGDGGGSSLPADKVAGMAAEVNVQAAASVIEDGELQPANIRWRWPRIRAATYIIRRTPIKMTFLLPWWKSHPHLPLLRKGVLFSCGGAILIGEGGPRMAKFYTVRVSR